MIDTPRFRMRELAPADVTERYLAWFDDPDARRYISAAATTAALEDLKRYVGARVNRRDVLFLGIFDRSSGVHIGNIKYEPLDQDLGYAVMGILIGEASFRGKGVAREVLEASAGWLHEHRHIRQIALGVHTANVAAIRAYESAGFVPEPTPFIPNVEPGGMTMIKRL